MTSRSDKCSKCGHDWASHIQKGICHERMEGDPNEFCRCKETPPVGVAWNRPTRVTRTHTHVILELSKAAYDEIKNKLSDAGYQHLFDEDEGRTIIDMHGIAVAEER